MDTLQPNSRHCFVCGLENPFGLKLRFHQTADGEVTTYHTVPENYQGYPGVVHGGIVAAMLDEVLGRALMGTDSQNTRFLYTAKLSIRYRKNVPVGKPIKIVGRITREKKKSAQAAGWIFDEVGDILAEAEGLLIEVPPEVLEDADLEALGWRVYPVEDTQPGPEEFQSLD